MPAIRVLTVNRRLTLRRRLVEYPEFFETVLSEWRRMKPGLRDYGFLTLDWLLVEDNWVKLMEGNYRIRTPREPRDDTKYDALRKYGKTWRQP